MRVAVATAILLGLCTTTCWADTSVPLRPPAPAYPRLLDHSCGGVRTATFAVGFDADGNVLGVVHAWTTCNVSGRSYRTKTFSSWHSLVWNAKGELLAATQSAPASPDPGFTATDAVGRTISTRRTASGYLAVLTTP